MVTTGKDDSRHGGTVDLGRDALEQLAPWREVLVARCGELLAVRHPVADEITVRELVTRLDKALNDVRYEGWAGGTQAMRSVGDCFLSEPSIAVPDQPM